MTWFAVPESVAASEEDLSAQEPEQRGEKEKRSRCIGIPRTPSRRILTLRPLRSASPRQGDQAEPPTNPLDAEDKKIRMTK